MDNINTKDIILNYDHFLQMISTLKQLNNKIVKLIAKNNYNNYSLIAYINIQVGINLYYNNIKIITEDILNIKCLFNDTITIFKQRIIDEIHLQFDSNIYYHVNQLELTVDSMESNTFYNNIVT